MAPSNISSTSAAFDDLAHSLRILLEAHIRAHGGGLLTVDRAEAIGNIENALTAALNSFHSLYDAIKSETQAPPIDWYKNGPLATILTLRNARHHNHANKIRTLYNYHAREVANPSKLTSYVLVDFPAGEAGADTFDVFISWQDLKSLLSMPTKQSRLPEATSSLIRDYLHTGRFVDYAREYELTEQRVFFNVVPLIVDAAATITPLIKKQLTTLSMEGEAYAELFSDMPLADTENPDVICGPIDLV